MEDEASVCLPEYNSLEKVTYQKPFPVICFWCNYIWFLSWGYRVPLTEIQRSAVWRTLRGRASSPVSTDWLFYRPPLSVGRVFFFSAFFSFLPSCFLLPPFCDLCSDFMLKQILNLFQNMVIKMALRKWWARKTFACFTRPKSQENTTSATKHHHVKSDYSVPFPPSHDDLMLLHKPTKSDLH